jgi:hypothetical protein
MQIPVAGTDTGFESNASRVEIFIPWRPIYHHPRTGKPRSHSATPELLLLNSPLSCPLLSRVAQKIANRLRIAHPPQRMSDAGGGSKILPHVSEGSSLCRLS